MQGKISKVKKRKSKRNKRRTVLSFSQERASYFFFIGLLMITIFGCVASGAPRQGFYGMVFVSIGILVTLFPPVFITPKWLNIGLVLFLISLALSLLPRSFAGSQSWRIDLESLGLETGNLISPHPVVTIESIIIVGSILILVLCSLGHRISRDNFLKISSLFVGFVALYAGISILYAQNAFDWEWDPNDGFGFFANRNHMATLMVMGSLLGVGSLFLYLKKKNWKGFVITLLALGIICWAILGYSVSRAGMILFISFQIIWFLFVGKKHLNYKFFTSFLVLFSLAIILFFLSDTTLEDRLENLLKEKEPRSELINSDKKSNYTSILGLRKYIHDDTFQMIQSEPWTGIGLGTYEFIFPFYKKECIIFNERALFSNVLHPESNWLDLASQAGISSLALSLICILSLLVYIILKNRKSRSWLLSLSCILSVFCILVHGMVDVPGQKVGIIMSGIFLIGINIKPEHSKDKISPEYATLIYQLLAIGIFSLGLTLVHKQWFGSGSIAFSNTQVSINKIQNLYNLSIIAAEEKDTKRQKDHIISAIDLCEKALKRSPLDPDLHFIRGKLYSFLDGNEEKIKFSFKIESELDSGWFKLPLRQSQVWLFIDIKETRRLWAEALERSNKLDDRFVRYTWSRILVQARQNPIQLRDVYELILVKDNPNFIKQWMSVAGSKILKTEIPKIIQNQLLSHDTKKKILTHWKRLSPTDFDRYHESLKLGFNTLGS